MNCNETDAAEGFEPAASCARSSGVSPAAARLPKPTAQTLENYARIRDLAAMGATRRQIAREIGLGYDRIREIIRMLRIECVHEARTGQRYEPKPPKQRDEGHDAPPTVPRRCLCGCNAMFPSSHVGERIAPRCRSSWEAR